MLRIASASHGDNGARAVLIVAALIALAGPAAAAGTGYLFVSQERSNAVRVLDPAHDYAEVASIATSLRPRDMHFNKDHSLLYVACGDDDTIDVIDVAGLKVVDHIPTGTSPEMFQIAPDGRSLYVSDEEDAVVRNIDIASKQMIREIATGPEPEGIAISKDGKTLYATSEVADLVHVIDTAAGAVTDNILVGTRPRRFVTPPGNELWVSDELSGEVSIIDRTTNRVTDTLEFLPPGFRPSDVTPVGLALSKDGKTVFVSLGHANHVAFVDAASHQIETYVLVGSRAWGVDVSADGKRLYVANGLSDDITIVDIAARKALKSVPVGRVPHTIVVDE